MSAGKLLEFLVIATMFCAPAFAADPPASDAAPAGSDAEATPDSATVLEKGRAMRKRSDEGDAAATFEFWKLLVGVRTGGLPASPEHLAEWRKLGGNDTVSSWLFKAAEGGHQPAIDGICRLGEDRLAPARLRDDGAARCAELRKKFPAQ